MMLSTTNEIMKGLFGLAAEIAEREKKKAINEDNYINATVLQICESLSKDVRKSIS
jgi:hypothetical protein